jgi:cholest-4-en-3-one 26-monooxygenase
MVGYDDPEYTADPAAAAAELIGYSMAMAENRRRCPRDDIVTKLVHAEVDGGQLSPDEFGFFVILLAVAGNETTRNAISHGMLAFFDHPDQWELFRDERPDTAADEIIRWATPVTVFQRTALADTTLGGQLIRAGQRVGLFYRSANFDEEVFDHPERFDIRRSPNPHLGFGGSGAHFCLGASLARLEIELIFSAIANTMPGISRAGDPVRLRSGWLNGIKWLPVSYT